MQDIDETPDITKRRILMQVKHVELEMLRMRGYELIAEPWELLPNTTIEENKAKLQMFTDQYKLDVAADEAELNAFLSHTVPAGLATRPTCNRPMYVEFCVSKEVGVSPRFNIATERAFSVNVIHKLPQPLNVILITDVLPSNALLTRLHLFASNTQLHIQLFELQELTLIPTLSFLTSDHHILTAKEQQLFFKENNVGNDIESRRQFVGRIKPLKLQNILIARPENDKKANQRYRNNDAVVKFLGARNGDIVRITRCTSNYMIEDMVNKLTTYCVVVEEVTYR